MNSPYEVKSGEIITTKDQLRQQQAKQKKTVDLLQVQGLMPGQKGFLDLQKKTLELLTNPSTANFQELASLLTQFNSRRSKDEATQAELAVQAAFSVMTLEQQMLTIEQAIGNDALLNLDEGATKASVTEFLRQNPIKALLKTVTDESSPEIYDIINRTLTEFAKLTRDPDTPAEAYAAYLKSFITEVLGRPDMFPDRVILLAIYIRRTVKKRCPNMDNAELIKFVGGIVLTRYLCPMIYPACCQELESQMKEKYRRPFQQNVLKFLTQPLQGLIAVKSAALKNRDETIYIEENIKGVEQFLTRMSHDTPIFEHHIHQRCLYNDLVALLITLSKASGHDPKGRADALCRYSHTQASAPKPERIDKFILHVMQTLMGRIHWKKINDGALESNVVEKYLAPYYKKGNPVELLPTELDKMLLSAQTLAAELQSKGCLDKDGFPPQLEKAFLFRLIVKAQKVRKKLEMGLYDLLGIAIDHYLMVNMQRGLDITERDPALLKLKSLVTQANKPEQKSYCRNNRVILMYALLNTEGNAALTSIAKDILAASGYDRGELKAKLTSYIEKLLPNTSTVAFSAANTICKLLTSDTSIAEINNPFAGINDPKRSTASFSEAKKEETGTPTIGRKGDTVTAEYHN